MKKKKTKTKSAAKKKTTVTAIILKNVPFLATRELVPIPGLVVPIYIGKGVGTEAVNIALVRGRMMGLLLQTGPFDENPQQENLARVGALTRIVHCVTMPNGDMKVKLHVQTRAKVLAFPSLTPVILANIEELPEKTEMKLNKKHEALLNEVKQQFSAIAQYHQGLEDHVLSLQEIFDPGELADLIASVYPFEILDTQRVLEESNSVKRLELVAHFLSKQVDVAQIRARISNQAERELGKMHQEELLREQMRQIQAELGEAADNDTEINDLKEALKKLRMPANVRKEAEKQMRRLQQLHPDTSEAALARTYIDWLLDIPWGKRTRDSLDIKQASKILDEDHYGLEKTKERILDFLGVRQLKKDLRGPILLLVGPPGVGKTSLGKAIARALSRKFVRVSVGGLRDEAELRGHRRTYVGALPGRVIQGLKNAGSMNPVFMLDELDKIGSDFRGDPSSVLLEVLDPEQNKAFEDHYLNVPVDLSEVMFVATANDTSTIPAPLLDRMETIEISGYTTEEKLQISKRYLIGRAKDANGLAKHPIAITDQTVLSIIEEYTRESGVRELDRAINTVFRKIARRIAEKQEVPTVLTPEHLEANLGPVRYVRDERLSRDEVGIATGLAWTSVGGEILTLEVTRTKGKGVLSLTGQLGEVMRESAHAALTFVQSRAVELGIDPDFYDNSNLHIHIPHGAIPKDGPSAGIAIATALVSLLTDRPVSRNVAMTGEMTLRGKVLEIGGLKEKALAALRIGIPVVIIPKANERELKEFPKYLLDKVTFVPAETIEEVLGVALLPKSEKLPLEDALTRSKKRNEDFIRR